MADKSATYSSFSASLSAGWEPDFWGRVRREVEGSRARFAASADDLESTRLGVQAEVAIDYFALRSLDVQHALFEETIETYRRFLELTRNRHKSGIASRYDESLAETQLRSAEAQLPAVELQRANLVHALATLCGQPATTFAFGAATNRLPAPPAIPVSIPSELLERRPDIAAAERRMAAANADAGVAACAFYPRVILNGLAGLQRVVDQGVGSRMERRTGRGLVPWPPARCPRRPRKKETLKKPFAVMPNPYCPDGARTVVVPASHPDRTKKISCADGALSPS